jgi:adenine-specific DNA-methyltransferase
VVEKLKMATGNPTKKNLLSDEEFTISYAGKECRDTIIEGDYLVPIDWIEDSAEGHLFFGDNLSILRSLHHNSDVRGKVDLVYIDPPFASGSSFSTRTLIDAYTDRLVGASYIEFLRKRIILLYEILAERGSIYIHLDDRMIFPVKQILDEIFGVSNFRNFIIRKKSNPKNYTKNVFGNIADYILFYSKSDKYIWNRQTEELSTEHLKEYRYFDENGRQHMRVPLHAPGIRNGASGGEWRGMKPPPGKHWQYIPETLEQLDRDGHIHWSVNGNPRKKVYLDEHSGMGVQDIWMNFKDAHNQNIRITGYPTEKNPDLLKRIISASSNEGSLVLDCFVGSGTTLDIAGQMGRSWIGIDCSIEAIQTICKRIDLGSEKMGDFVSEQKQHKSSQRSLFEQRSRIFSFSCDPSCLEQLNDKINVDGVDRFSYLSKNIITNAQSKISHRSLSSVID